MNEVAKTFSIQSYIEKNREKLDESLVSLRIMKEVDKFLDYENLSNKELAQQMGYSESYISQLMSGMKSINTSFINKFEKRFRTKFDFKIYLKDDEEILHRLNERTHFHININLNMLSLNHEGSHFSLNQNSNSMFDVTDVEYENL